MGGLRSSHRTKSSSSGSLAVKKKQDLLRWIIIEKYSKKLILLKQRDKEWKGSTYQLPWILFYLKTLCLCQIVECLMGEKEEKKKLNGSSSISS